MEKYTKEFNGFVGIGATARQAEIACAYASVYLPLDGSDQEKTAIYGDLGGWNGGEEACYEALVGKSAKSAA